MRRSPLGNVIAKLTSEGTGRIFNVLLSIIGARVLGPAAWGTYWSAFGIAQLAALGTDLGGHLTMSRNVARSPGTAWTSASIAAAMKLILTIIVILTVIAVTPALRQRAPLLWPVTAAALTLSMIEWLGCFLRGLGRVREEAILLGSTSFVGCLAGALVLTASASPERLAVSQLLAMAACLAAAILWTLRMLPLRGWDPTPSDRALTGFFRSAWPTGAAILISMCSWRLVYLLNPPVAFPEWPSPLGIPYGEGIGLYAVAQRLLEIGRFLPAAAAAALFPSFAGGRGLAPGQATRWLAGFTTASAGALWIPGVADGAVTMIFGARYAPAAPILAVLALALPFMSVNAVMTHWLVARGHAGTNAALSTIHLAVHLIWLIGFPALQAPPLATVDNGQLLSYSVPYPYHFSPALLAAGLVFAEMALTIGTLIVWRRLK